MKPTYLLENEKGVMAWVVLTLLAIIVIAAVLVMKLMPIAPTPLPASPPVVVRMKIPPIPKAEPQEANRLQLPPEVEGRAETVSDQPHEDSTPAEPNVDASAALSSPMDASSDTGTVAARSSVAEGADIEPPSAKASAPTTDATPLVQEKTEVAPEQEAPADRGEPVQTATIEAMEDVSPSAASDPANDLAGTEIKADVATESPGKPVGVERPEPTGAATASKNEALFTVQVGAFHTKAYADAKLEELKILGYPAYLLEVMDRKQLTLYLVCFGRFQTLAEAGDTIAAFKKKEKMPAVAYRKESW